jgi:hypothetical protein
MVNRAFPAFWLLVLLFVVGTWEDILPGLDGVRSQRVSKEPSHSEDDRDGQRPTVIPAEPVLICDVPLPPLVVPAITPSFCVNPDIPEPHFIFPIAHVPILWRRS